MPNADKKENRKYPKYRKRRPASELVQNKAKGVVTDLMQGKTLKETGEKYFPNAKYPVQTVSNSLERPAYQRAIRMLTKDYTPDDLRAKAAELLENGTETTKVAVLRLAMQEKAMLVERHQVDNMAGVDKQYKRLEGLSLDELQREVMRRIEQAMPTTSTIETVTPTAPERATDANDQQSVSKSDNAI